MTFTIPDSWFPSLKGYKTIGAGLIGLLLPFCQQYIPWVSPELLMNIAWAAVPAAIIFSRLGSKDDADKAVEQIKVLLETPINAEPVIEEKVKK